MAVALFTNYKLPTDIVQEAAKIREHILNQNGRTTWKRELFHGFCIRKAYESQGIVKTAQELCCIVGYPNPRAMENFIRKKSRSSVSGVYTSPVKQELKTVLESHCVVLGYMTVHPLISVFASQFENKVEFESGNLSHLAAAIIVAYVLVYHNMFTSIHVSTSLGINTKTVEEHFHRIVDYLQRKQGYKYPSGA